MRKRTNLVMTISTLAVVWLAPGVASAHNSGHLIRPDGTCVDVGSSREAPFVGAGNPNQSPGFNPAGQLDLIPGPGDQYGARFAADHSPTLLPGPCP